jgi:tetratricopeptide (TPR) repeat protein
MRLLTSAGGLKVRSGAAWLLTLACLSVPLGLLSSCSEPEPTTSGSTTPSTGRPGELAYVTDDELARFVDGTPDHTIKFPEENYVNGRKLLVALKYDDSEKILKEGLADAVKSSAGETKLGQYCVRLNNALYYEAQKLFGKGDGPKPKYTAKYQESLKYGILASRIFYKQPPAQRPMAPWFFNVNMFMGFSYKALGRFKEAEAHLRKAINVAASAPTGQEDWPFHRLCYLELIDTLKKDKQPPAVVKQLEQELKAIEAKH